MPSFASRLAPAVRAFAFVALLVAFGLLAFSAGILTERRVLSSPAAAATAECGGMPIGAVPDGVSPEVRAGFDDFCQTWGLIHSEYYYRPVDSQKMVYGATRGMLSVLGDDYTTFLEPVQQQVVREQMSGDYEGIGAYVESVNGRITISSPMKGAPAEQAGLRARDVILKVDGREVTGMPLDEAIKLVRGKAGTVVRLTIERPGGAGPFDIDVTRAVINIPSVTLRMLEGDIAHVNVTIFGDKTTAQLDDALKEARANNARAVILDLRNNGGGWVAAAQEMVGRFVDPGRGPALYEDRTHGAQVKAILQTPTATAAPRPAPGTPGTPTAVTPTAPPPTIDATDAKSEPILAGGDAVKVYDLPLVVLVNGGTASASEIVVGALQDYDRATLIGTRTFGKGSIQSVHEFKDGSSARITIAQWLTPKKRMIQQRGLTPDLIVEQPQEGDDLQLQRAIKYLQEGQ